RAALAQDGDLLATEERGALEASVAALDSARRGDEHRAIKSAIDALNHASGAFAARRMNRAIAAALSGRNVDEVSK
ncbi:MAG TPA: Fe-S protein assembly chaperone HscA, partial [Usitatibacter sp.]|nr:Fe-S protein assembly chaperone HscA [Usitatibacter sp.]